jgi:hypothetical protein
MSFGNTDHFLSKHLLVFVSTFVMSMSATFMSVVPLGTIVIRLRVRACVNCVYADITRHVLFLSYLLSYLFLCSSLFCPFLNPYNLSKYDP